MPRDEKDETKIFSETEFLSFLMVCQSYYLNAKSKKIADT